MATLERACVQSGSVLAISKYFMLIRCLENISEGLLHACISSHRNNRHRMRAPIFSQ